MSVLNRKSLYKKQKEGIHSTGSLLGGRPGSPLQPDNFL